MKISDIYNAQGAAAYVQTSDPANSMPYLGEAFFPVRKKMGIDLKWIKTHKGIGVSLAPSNFDALSTIRPREGFSFTKTEMPFFRESMIVKEQDEMDIMRVHEMNDPYIDQVLSNIYDDVATLTEGARINMERMRMQLLSGNGGSMGISIGTTDQMYLYNYDPSGAWAASNYEDITGTATQKWGTSTATPITDLNDAKTALAALGYTAKYVLMNTATFNLAMKSDEIASAYYTLSGLPSPLIDAEALKTVIDRKTGLQLLIYDKVYKDYDGTSYKYYPDNFCTIISDQQLGTMWAGTTPEERTLIGDSKVNVAVTDDGIAIAVKTDYGPPVQTKTTVSEIILPSFEGMDGIYVMKVNA